MACRIIGVILCRAVVIFFTVNFLERKRDLLADHIDLMCAAE
ncbi:hypothetical protein [Methylotuvimicrobium buryatense]|nr:hypothetical protein [Methylotuvimicrobium buryatense]